MARWLILVSLGRKTTRMPMFYFRFVAHPKGTHPRAASMLVPTLVAGSCATRSRRQSHMRASPRCSLLPSRRTGDSITSLARIATRSLASSLATVFGRSQQPTSTSVHVAAFHSTRRWMPRKHLTRRCSEPRPAPMRSFRVVSTSNPLQCTLPGAVADLVLVRW